MSVFLFSMFDCCSFNFLMIFLIVFLAGIIQLSRHCSIEVSGRLLLNQVFHSIPFVVQVFSCYLFLRPDFLDFTFSITFTALQVKFVLVTSFLFLGHLRYLPHSRMTSELTYANIY